MRIVYFGLLAASVVLLSPLGAQAQDASTEHQVETERLKKPIKIQKKIRKEPRKVPKTISRKRRSVRKTSRRNQSTTLSKRHGRILSWRLVELNGRVLVNPEMNFSIVGDVLYGRSDCGEFAYDRARSKMEQMIDHSAQVGAVERCTVQDHESAAIWKEFRAALAHSRYFETTGNVKVLRDAAGSTIAEFRKLEPSAFKPIRIRNDRLAPKYRKRLP